LGDSFNFWQHHIEAEVTSFVIKEFYLSTELIWILLTGSFDTDHLLFKTVFIFLLLFKLKISYHHWYRCYFRAVKFWAKKSMAILT